MNRIQLMPLLKSHLEMGLKSPFYLSKFEGRTMAEQVSLKMKWAFFKTFVLKKVLLRAYYLEFD